MPYRRRAYRRGRYGEQGQVLCPPESILIHSAGESDNYCAAYRPFGY